MNKLLSLQYYFTPRPDFNFQYTSIVLVVVALFLIGSIALSYCRRKKIKDVVLRKVIKTYPSRLWWFGIALLFLLLFRETGLPYLSMRIWWFVWLAILIYWVARKATSFKKDYNQRLESRKRSAQVNKYLPKRKKR